VGEAQSVGSWAVQWHARTRRLQELEQQLARDPGADVQLWLERATVCEALGLHDDAKRAYLDVLVRDPSHYDAMMGLGELLARSGDANGAGIFFAEAVLRHPQRALPHARLGHVLLERDELDAASAALRDALQLDPDLREANRGLAAVLERSGDHAAAERAWRKAYPSGSLDIAPYRGAGAPVRVLLLTSATGGNIPIQHLLDDRVFEVATVIAEADPGMTVLPPHGVVLNAIGEADRSARALAIVERALERSGAVVVNHPSLVRATGRAANARRLALLDGVVCPSIVAFARDDLRGPAGAALVTERGFTWPLLLRSPGFHTGEHFALVEGAAQLAAVAESLPGPELLAISYVETRGADERWRKYRVMFVDGQLYPLHLAIAAQWKVHYFSAGMADDARRRDEERTFLEDMAGTLGPRAMDALARIAATLGLDYGGVDFAFDREGRVVVFEANATMVITGVDDDPRWAYRKTAMNRVADAVRAMIVERAQRW
jgi:glutathione synthase/RimK-type ligase-like ATP-grasp enzyme